MRYPRPQLKVQIPGQLVEETDLPDQFTAEDMTMAARFYNVDGLPVSFGRLEGCPFRCAMWSDGRPRIYSEARVHQRGKPITEAAFRDLITACRLGY